MKKTLLPVLAAFLLSAPAVATQETAVTEAGSEDPDLDLFAALMGSMDTSEPLSAEAEARLPAAREVVAYLVPEGTYRELMDKTFGGVLGSMGDLLKPSPQTAVAKLTGLTESDLVELDQETLAEIALALDPAYVERADIGMKAIMDGVADIMVKAEPSFREGYAAAYAEHFTAEQLADLRAFFQTPTGNYYASQSMALTSDPRVMAKMPEIFPLVMGELPALMAEVESQLAALPPERYFDMLDPAEQERISSLLGYSAEDLSALSGFARATGESEEGIGDGGFLEEVGADPQDVN